MPTKGRDFAKLVTQAYEHLYDIVFLRSHPLADMLIPGSLVQPRDKAWQLHHFLLRAVDELKPDPRAPGSGLEQRRYQLLVRRYVDGAPPQQVADELGVSRRHYYRLHDQAIQAIAAVLLERRPASLQEQQAHADRLSELRLEVARLAQRSRYVSIEDVLESVVPVLKDGLASHDLRIESDLPVGLPELAVDGNLLRQTLLTVLGYLAKWSSEATVCLAARVQGAHVSLRVSVEPAVALRPTVPSATEECLSILSELAELSQVRVEPWPARSRLAGFALQLPVRTQRTVLVVDDNEDVLELFRRYLTLHQYGTALARSASEALAMAEQLQPYAITLDVMMPERDGWDVLQALRNRASTQHIPVIVCSVLRARDLALYLGASAFLPKPVSEEALVRTLEALAGRGIS